MIVEALVLGAITGAGLYYITRWNPGQDEPDMRQIYIDYKGVRYIRAWENYYNEWYPVWRTKSGATIKYNLAKFLDMKVSLGEYNYL